MQKSISMHKSPMRPGGHSHSKPPRMFEQFARGSQGSNNTHSSISVSQSCPVKFEGQSQRYVLPSGKQVPSLRHGIGAQGIRTISHLSPVKPGIHSQVKLFIPSIQVPLFKH